ncbi:MAG: hypothetical protein DRJ98_01545 [Thermoprotei archaeon]|nr:MAG: hypothetical protein DRJ98_01545 [Thermoprotei archaeon]RLF13397.1 MAG: hypothetical protein DRN06_08695 [Thermoprotei archaeon]
MYSELKDTWRLERSSYRLQKLPSDLYERARGYLAKLRAKLSGDPSSLNYIIAEQEMAVLKALIEDLFNLRVHKALALTLEGYQVSELLTKEERAVVVSALTALFQGKEDFLKSLVESVEEPKMTLIRFLKPAPRLMEGDVEYGPFEAEELAYLPRDVAQRYVEEGTAVELD